MPECKFSNSRGIYSCYFHGKYQFIPSEVNEKIFDGKHFDNHTNDDVKELELMACKLYEFPKNLGEIFKNLTILKVSYANLKEISNKDLRQFPKLEEFELRENQLEYLPGDLFKFNQKLRKVSFEWTSTKFVGEEIFDGLKELEEVEFEFKIFRSSSEEDDAYSFEKLKLTLIEKYKPPQDYLIKIKHEHEAAKVKVKFDDKLLKDIKAINLKDLKDLTIKVSYMDFKVHKFVVMARCPKIADLILSNPKLNEVKLNDISIEIFEHILKFIYTDEAPNDPKIARKVFLAASYLKMQKLMDITKNSAEECLMDEMKDKSLDFLMEHFEMAIKNKSDNLKRKTFEEMHKFFPGKKLKRELLDEPEKLRKLIEAKKIQDQMLD